MNSKLIKIGHRGAMGYEPENTLRSFEKAIELGADMVEFDVRLCKSGEVVVIHDKTVDRTTNGKGRVIDLTLAELKALDAGNGQHVPTLEEVLDAVNKRVAVNIELKERRTAAPVADVVWAHCRKGWRKDLFLISSGYVDELLRFRLLDKTARLGVLFKSKYVLPFGWTRILRAYSLNPPLEYATPQLVQKAHRLGLKVFVWTVNSEDDITRMKNMGVDGIFSNFPDRLKS